MGSLMKSPRVRLPLSIVTVLVCVFALVALLYNERISSPSSSSIFRFKSCSKQGNTRDEETMVDAPVKTEADDRFEFDPNECSVAHGKWVFNSSLKPLYTDRTCPYIDRQFACAKNGRPDSDYRHWEWQPDDCMLPRFNPRVALQKLRGKRLMFVGDSLNRNQWESFVCLVEFVVPKDQKSMRLGKSHSVFHLKEYNATIEFYWAPFLVESNSDNPIIGDPRKRILRVDSVSKHAKYWEGVDILAFNTYVWWMSGPKMKSLWGSFANGEEGFEELETPVAYRLGLKTWANWIDSTIDPNQTRKRRLEPQGRDQMLQRNEAGDEERPLGNRFQQADDERGGERGGEDESPGHLHQHHADIRPGEGGVHSGAIMAGGNFMHRVMSYVVNELVVNGLANSPAFQRFAVRTSKRLEDISNKAAQTREELAKQLKEASKNFEVNASRFQKSAMTVGSSCG
ncbi:hypothetical protein RHMOL_Rhmol05G0303000 [Rhododendron molle]|uniref:Uncharacterized protein n=1 Tax=Rhododendron molle TaxID=49168 RepID=A0ACC0NUT4_RHOML|nr:hypothetical protein RHMOL_Rhmol05G0303000 [Rhododendron molle]